MNEQEYLKDRVDDQIAWYDKKSQWNQKSYKRLRLSEILMSILIPFLTGLIYTGNIYSKVFIGILGVAVAVVASVLNLYKFQENWIEYRTTAETLKHEKFLYLTKSGPYSTETPFSTFVERFESCISKENTNWAQYIRKKDKEGKVDG